MHFLLCGIHASLLVQHFGGGQAAFMAVLEDTDICEDSLGAISTSSNTCFAGVEAFPSSQRFRAQRTRWAWRTSPLLTCCRGLSRSLHG